MRYESKPLVSELLPNHEWCVGVGGIGDAEAIWCRVEGPGKQGGVRLTIAEGERVGKTVFADSVAVSPGWLLGELTLVEIHTRRERVEFGQFAQVLCLHRTLQFLAGSAP